jgi:hypothetical protein
VRSALSPYIKQIRFVFKGLNNPIILPDVYFGQYMFFQALEFKQSYKCQIHCVNYMICISFVVLITTEPPIPVAMRSKAWVFGRSRTGIAGSTCARGTDVSLLRVLCVVR